MPLKIVQYPDPILKKKSVPVQKVDKDTQKLIEDMFETMYAAPGVGLAAVQVGVLQRVLVIDVGRLEDGKRRPDPLAIINPVIVEREGKIEWEEGCLSLPEMVIPMERSKKIVVAGLDATGQPIKIAGEDLMSVAFQHEIDHLDGLLLVDRLSRLKRELYRKQLEKQGPEEPVEKGVGPVYLG